MKNLSKLITVFFLVFIFIPMFVIYLLDKLHFYLDKFINEDIVEILFFILIFYIYFLFNKYREKQKNINHQKFFEETSEGFRKGKIIGYEGNRFSLDELKHLNKIKEEFREFGYSEEE